MTIVREACLALVVREVMEMEPCERGRPKKSSSPTCASHASTGRRLEASNCSGASTWRFARRSDVA
jgi:hypothetical protein